MPETRLQYRALVPRSMTNPSIDEVLDEIFDALNNDIEYANPLYGERIPGSSMAWTAERQQITGTSVAISCIPPTGAVNDIRILFAGSASSSSPTMLSPDSFATDLLFYSIAKGITSETLNNWEESNPYGGGVFSGFWGAARSYAGDSSVALRIYETGETIVITIDDGANNVSSCLGGALWDAGSPSGGENGTGKIYGLMTGGNINTGLSVTFWTGGTQFTGHNTSPTQAHSGYFVPGTSDWQTAGRIGGNISGGTGPTNANLRTNSDTIAAVPFVHDGGYRFREGFMSVDTQNGFNLLSSGTEVGYFIGASRSASQDALLITT